MDGYHDFEGDPGRVEVQVEEYEGWLRACCREIGYPVRQHENKSETSGKGRRAGMMVVRPLKTMSRVRFGARGHRCERVERRLRPNRPTAVFAASARSRWTAIDAESDKRSFQRKSAGTRTLLF